MPVVNGELAYQHDGMALVAFLEQFEDIPSVFMGHVAGGPLVDDEQVKPCECRHEFWVPSVVSGRFEFLKQFWGAQIPCAVSLAAGAVCQGACDEGFARACGTADGAVFMMLYPSAIGQDEYLLLLQPPGRIEIDVMDGGAPSQCCLAQAQFGAIVFAPGQFSVNKQPQTVLER